MRAATTAMACVLLLVTPVETTLADDAAAPTPIAAPTAPTTAVPAESGAAAPTTSSAAATATAPTPGAAAPASAATATATASGDPIKLGIAVPPPSDFKPPPGFRAVKKGLETVYCKSSTPVGSRLPQQVCYSQEQAAAVARQAEMDRQLLHQKSTNGGTSGN